MTTLFRSEACSNMEKLAEFSRVASGFYLKAIVVAPDTGRLWYSDALAGGIFALGSGINSACALQSKLWIGSILVNEDGCLLVSGAGGISWFNPDVGDSGWLLQTQKKSELDCINAMAPDGGGGLYFATADMRAISCGDAPRPSSIYRLDVTGRLSRLTGNLGFVNALALNCGEDRLICVESDIGIHSFAIRSDRSLDPKTVMKLLPSCDGLALDQGGNLLVGSQMHGQILHLSNHGDVLDVIDTPAETVTQLCFAGSSLDTLVVADVPLDRGTVFPQGRLPARSVSSLWRTHLRQRGRPIAATRFKLRQTSSISTVCE